MGRNSAREGPARKRRDQKQGRERCGVRCSLVPVQVRAEDLLCDGIGVRGVPPPARRRGSPS